MASHPFAQLTTCNDSLGIHHRTKYKVTDAGSKHHGKD
jgi:hypothetical protein